MKLRDETAIRIKYFLTATVTTIGVYLAFRYILPLILPFIFAYFIAWIIRPITEFLYNKIKLPRIIGGIISITILTGILGVGLCYLFNTLMKQAVLLIKNIPIYFNIVAGKLDNICEGCDTLFGLTLGSARSIVDDNVVKMIDGIKNSIMPELTKHTLSLTVKMISAIGIILITLVAAVLIVKDLPAFRKRYENSNAYKDIHKVTAKLAEAGIAYLRSQFIIMLIVAVICVLGLIFIKNDYALLLGIGIAIMDALPILGSGMVLIPWGIIMLVNGSIFTAAVLITIYLVCQIIREILEPKLIGNRIGIKPLFTLISMYIGLKLFSIAGFFLGPIGLIIIITVVKVVIEKLRENSNYAAMDRNDFDEE